MNPFEMVVLFVAIVMVTSVLKARYKNAPAARSEPDQAENARLRHEIASLKDRVAVLERLATDEAGPRALEREIEKLRSRDG